MVYCETRPLRENGGCGGGFVEESSEHLVEKYEGFYWTDMLDLILVEKISKDMIPLKSVYVYACLQHGNISGMINTQDV